MFDKLREHRDAEAAIVADTILTLMNLKIIPKWSMGYGQIHHFLTTYSKIRVENL